jgi:hypothetical protein
MSSMSPNDAIKKVKTNGTSKKDKFNFIDDFKNTSPTRKQPRKLMSTATPPKYGIGETCIFLDEG